MTITIKSETLVTNSGETMFVEQYQDKGCARFWRYGYMPHGMPHGIVVKDMLLSKPNKKRLIETY